MSRMVDPSPADAGGAGFPSPHLNIASVVTTMIWSEGDVVHRIHARKYGGDVFNPGLAGNARFSPIVNASKRAIPTLYGGSDFACAAMETIFHDVPYAAGPKNMRRGLLEDQVYSRLVLAKDVILADLGAIELRKLGISRSHLIETGASHYPRTRLWAEAIHAQCPDIQGLCWVSRQHDGTRAMMLFGDRIEKDGLVLHSDSRALLGDDALLGDVYKLATRLDVRIFDERL